jgi:oxygen-dependent protoporphyrinogen oxidase
MSETPPLSTNRSPNLATDPPGSARPHIVVIGGGVTGLAAAHRLRELFEAASRPFQLTLLEASPRVGGVFGTREIAGYRVETGADSFITNKPWALELCLRLGLESRLISTDVRYRRSLVLRNGRPHPVPDGFQLLSPVKIGSILRSSLFTWGGKLRMAADLILPGRRERTDESLAAFARRRFGREAFERLIQPMVGGIYTADPEKLSMHATMLRFVAHEAQFGSVIRGMWSEDRKGQISRTDGASGARYGLFASLRTGMQELIDRLRDRVAEVADLRLESRVTSLTRAENGNGWRLQIESKDAPPQAIACDAVVVALPTHAAARLLSPVDVDLGGQLGRIPYASTAIVVSGHKLANVRDPLNAFGLVIPRTERRRILAVSFTSRKFPDRAPEGCVQLRTFVGGATQPELLGQSDEEIVRLVREELQDILGVTGEPDFAHVARWNDSMPQYHVGHLDLVSAIEHHAAYWPTLALAGNAYHGVGLPDAIHSGEQAAERIAKAVRRT